MASTITWPTPLSEQSAGSEPPLSVVEREVKFSVPELGPVEARLRVLAGAGAVRLGVVHERNYVLDTLNDDLRARDERLRVREVDGRGGVQVTWKGPASVRRGVRRREEREFHADDRDACVAVLANLGLRPVRSYSKSRTSWRLNDVIVCLDRLPFGTFVEIEFTAEVSERGEPAALARAMALLGLHDAPRVQASYARLQQEWEESRPRRHALGREGAAQDLAATPH
ncbi:MAG TPA: class IV adenylate cyclase [Chloroflexota bacterium]|nr:class IV adenylate cyclase [Chloroflexota bacterium]